MRKAFILAVLGACFALAQPSIINTPWWENRLAINSLNLTEAQTKQLTSIQNASVGRLTELRGAVMKAESNLTEIYDQPEIDESKVDAAVNDYANARENLTRALTQVSLKMRIVLTQAQWQALENRQYNRGGPRGPGRGRRQPPAGSAGSANKVIPPPPAK